MQALAHIRVNISETHIRAEGGVRLTVNQKAYRSGMSRLAAAVNIITSVADGGVCGFTASAVCSVTDDPPTLLVCINRAAQSHSIIMQSRVLCVNTVGPSHEEIAMRFAGAVKEMAARFNGVSWSTATTGSPVLDQALVAFDCHVVDVHAIGTHDVLYCEVVDMRTGDDAAGLVYWSRQFHKLVLSPEM